MIRLYQLNLLFFLCLLAGIQLSFAQVAKKISGTVTNPDGQPLSGVSVQAKGNPSKSTTTDANGKFSINALKGQTLVLSYVGYATMEWQVAQDNAAIHLQPNNNKLDEVVVTALGIKRESRTIGYSVQKVDGKLIQESHETNLLNTLSGRVAGVQITNASGNIGASSNIQIRGQNFVSGYNYNNSPLFVVDGVPISNNNEQSTRAFTGRQDFN